VGTVEPTPAAAQARGVEFLVKARSPEGGWHSTRYRDMAEGPELSPFVLKALLYSNASKEVTQPSVDYLLAQQPSKTLIYPVYTSAGMLMARLDREGLWERFLLDFQADEHLGWSPADPSYGGWSYAMLPPRKPKGDIPTLSQSNLPSTLFALGGLSMAGALTPETSKKALTFLQRCQNFPGDGGFCASPSDPSMNKADGHTSYGSATSDGLRGLLRCGLAPDHPRVRAARSWTEKHLSSAVHPGDFPKGRFFDRDSLYFYYCWSTAHALAALQRAGAKLSAKELAWQAEIGTVIEGRQNQNGSWTNPAGATREDDPLVATPMALAILTLAEQPKKNP
jgi:hypothetical protein